MHRRWLSRVAAPVAVASLALGAGLAPVQASTTGWRIIKVFGSPTYPMMQRMATSGTTNAWAAGTDDSSLVLQHWTGSQWQSVTPPPGFANLAGASVNVHALGTSSSANMWVFPDVNGTADVQYALHWNGSAWTAFNLSSTNMILATAVFSGSNVWMFGQKPAASTTLGYGPAWVLHWNGSSWASVSVPTGTPVDVSAVSASDIWALGPSAATINNTTQTTIAMHWNGSTWHALSLPTLTEVSGHRWIPVAIVAKGANDVWVEDIVAGNLNGTPGPPGGRLLHWNGTSWVRVSKDLLHYYAPDLERDGNGGFWLASPNSTNPGDHIVHYKSGTWSRQPAPTETGYYGQAGAYARIPGTTSVWGLGALVPTGTGITESDILKFGP